MKTKEWRKQTKTKRSSLLISMFLLCILTFSLRIPSKAATPGVTKLNRNKTYTGYDLDSNGKKERLLYKGNAIYVNGRKVYSLNGYETDCTAHPQKRKTISVCFCGGRRFTVQQLQDSALPQRKNVCCGRFERTDEELSQQQCDYVGRQYRRMGR